MNVGACPECGAASNQHGTPGCGCAIRTGGTSAAPRESQDPLLIRPYVMQSPDQPVRAPEETARLPLPRTAYLPSTPEPEDLGLFTGEEAAAPGAPERVRGHGRGADTRSRPALMTLAAAGAVILLAGIAFATGMFSSDEAPEDRAQPDLPAVSESASGVSPSESEGPSKSASAEASKSASASASASTSASTSPSPSPSKSSPSATKTTSAPPPAGGPTLRVGSTGAEVVELQKRLNEARVYGSRDDGNYNGGVAAAVSLFQMSRGVEGDDSGVYGPATRRALEAETREP